jgi:hypothetical protein
MSGFHDMARPVSVRNALLDIGRVSDADSVVGANRTFRTLGCRSFGRRTVAFRTAPAIKRPKQQGKCFGRWQTSPVPLIPAGSKQ